MTTETSAPVTAVPHASGDWRWRALCCFFGLAPVGPLVAWMEGFGSFTLWWISFAVPAMVALAVIAAWPSHLRRHPTLRTALIAGTVGGIAGTFGYDLFRVPFVESGFRLFAPISSFGMLMLNAHGSSPATEFAGWAAHFSDGVGFGIAYSMIALGRRWWWGPIWGVFLESTTLITPYTRVYGLAGHWNLIGIALAAHLFYGTPLGLIVQRGTALTNRFDELSRHFAPAALVVLAVVIALWIRPWSTTPPQLTAAQRSAGVTLAIHDDEFVPQWIRVPVGSCVLVANDDSVPHKQTGPKSFLTVAAKSEAKMCFRTASIYRIKLSNAPYSGGFVLVDSAY